MLKALIAIVLPVSLSLSLSLSASAACPDISGTYVNCQFSSGDRQDSDIEISFGSRNGKQTLNYRDNWIEGQFVVGETHTRARVISWLEERVETLVTCKNDSLFIDEITTFVNTANGKPVNGYRVKSKLTKEGSKLKVHERTDDAEYIVTCEKK